MSERRGLNALMPVETNVQGTGTDVIMEQAPENVVHVEEVEEFSKPKPAPPFDPIIEDAKEDDPMETPDTGKPGAKSQKLNG